MKHEPFYSILAILIIHFTSPISAQQPIVLTLEQTINIAADSSLEAFRSKNMYLADYWQFRTYKAERLPSLALNLFPAEYDREIVRRYDSGDDRDVYREQQSFYSAGNLEVKQNFDLTGGSFFVNSNLGYMRSFGANTYTQFTSVPVRIGYQQSLLGYNPFKWQKKIEPLKFEKAKKQFLYNIEQVSEQATTAFFELATAQSAFDLAKENLASTDTLYRIGEQRQRIASITQADLLTLKLDAVNARNTLQNAEIALKRAMFSLASYLNFDKNTEIQLRLPERPRDMVISVEQATSFARENNPVFLDLQRQILEGEQQVDKTRKESLFNATLNASIGFNQVANTFKEVYQNPMQQDVVAFSISIPIVDWGVRKGKYNIAQNSLNVTRISARQNELSIEEDVIMTIGDFNVQQNLISSAEEAQKLSQMAYSETKQRFIIGKADINSLTLAFQRQQQAQNNYIQALKNYWLSYYKIRKLTLYDFEKDLPLSNLFDYKHGM
ncbi:membrane protein [Bacteroidia bacterium]|nr:membrane protein [Bacteroidia bacterium]